MDKEHIKLLSKVNDSLSMKFLDSDNILGLTLIINCQFIMSSSVSKQSDTYHHLLLMFPFC